MATIIQRLALVTAVFAGTFACKSKRTTSQLRDVTVVEQWRYHFAELTSDGYVRWSYNDPRSGQPTPFIDAHQDNGRVRLDGDRVMFVRESQQPVEVGRLQRGLGQLEVCNGVNARACKLVFSAVTGNSRPTVSLTLGNDGTSTGERIPVRDTTALPTTAGSQGKTGTEVQDLTLQGIQLKIIAPPKQSNAPYQMVIYLHGDTGGDWRDRYGFERKDEKPSIKKFVLENNLLLVAPYAPNAQPTGEATERSWWSKAEHADMLAAALKELGESYYAFKTDDILYAGSSGGSTFMTMHWFKNYGNVYPGWVAANCGGAAGGGTRFAFPPQEITRKTAFKFTYGDQDKLAVPPGKVLPNGDVGYNTVIQQAVQNMKDNGFDVEEEVIPGKGHCDATVNWQEKAIEVWKKHLVK